ncbi:MAG: DNA translocase FtsK, partial [Chloroflexota bacterium]
NLIGEITNKKTDDGARIVKRPDGREKRYFSVKEMQEAKKVGRRAKVLPKLDLLQEEAMELPDEEEINHKVVLIENTLLEFDVDIDVVNVQVGPTVTRYAVQPYRTNPDGTTERTRLGKIASYHSDLSLSLSAKRLRLEIPVPGQNYMGIEVPNKNPSVVTLRSVYESKNFYEFSHKDSSSPLAIPLGRDVSGQAVSMDIAKMPHLLIAGTTGSGKSVAIGAMATAILLSNPPDKVKMVMLDPKMVELSRFNGIPHLIGPVETDTERIIGVLKWCTLEMDRRYKVLEEQSVRNIDNYNEKFGSRRRGGDYMPHMLIMIDEIGDLMMNQPEETERAITRLAQMARAVGMHLVIATQRPSVDVITGLIKANFPGRVAFAVASGVDSRVILDAIGAEQLMGRGDMLYLAPDAGAPMRVQGCFVSDEETRAVVDHWKDWYEEQIEAGKLERNRIGPWQRGLTRREFLSETDPMLEDAIEYVVDSQEASASLIQRQLGLGYPRAARIMDMLEELGVVGEPVGGGRARKVLIPKGEDPFKRIIDKRVKERVRNQKKMDGFYDD